MAEPYRLKKPLGPTHDTDPEDIWATKQNLNLAGYYAVPKHGMTVYPDQQLFQAIRQFQRDNKLRVDGVMRPGGETERRILSHDDVAMTYRCRVCGAPHGGVYSPSIVGNAGTRVTAKTAKLPIK